MSFVLTTFSWRWDASHHSTKSFTTGPWPVSLSWSRLTITESSAYLIIVLFSHLLWHIFVYRMKSRGESTHPCGEPVDEQTFSERLPFTLTLCVLFVNKLRIQPTRLLLRSNCSSSLVVKIWGWIVLKAEEKSINKSLAWEPLLSKCLKSKFSKVTVASSTPYGVYKQIAEGQVNAPFFLIFQTSPIFQILSSLLMWVPLV